MTGDPCIVCGAAMWQPLYDALVRCAECGFVRAAEIPSSDVLAALYGRGYFEGEEYADYLGDRPAHEQNFRVRLKRLRTVAGSLESLYEIGCAYGLWLDVARKAGLRVAGNDITPEGVRHAAETLGLDARRCDFAYAALSPGAFQAFCMWDTIEHLPHPDRDLAKVSALLPPKGWFFCTTGDIGAPLAHRERARWRMIHPPTHLQYFSRESLTRLLARQGLQVRHIESTGMCRSLHGVLAGLQRFGSRPQRALARIAVAALPAAVTRRLRFTVDLGDIMLVCAQKP